MRSIYVATFVAAFFGAQACSADAPPAGGTRDDDSSRSAIGDEVGENEEPQETVLEPTPGEPIAPVSCKVTFRQHIYPRAVEQWRCGSSACHGMPGANAPAMDTSDAAATYAAWTNAKHLGLPLVKAQGTTAKESALSCLMAGTCGQRMPYQGVSEADRALVDGWLSCGAPF